MGFGPFYLFQLHHRNEATVKTF